MSTVEKAVEVVAIQDGEWRLGPKQGSVFPKKRMLVKSMIMKTLFSSRSPLKSKQIVELPRNKRVQSTLR
ncbi:hypothetical protein AtNW77_Chr1g0024171 [Arabidopsis thaliana]|uniref:Uncharacterized protein n=5 Tax=Arabidopsis TaxID=3701 RepID=A0A654ECW9_ARATH|nr:uncharacterized protein AT1G21528 [Arabidopsis thaliana]KAG7647111.1 hypothetical protein ISN45_At01g021790 [Arabidopsis thaliana x Arabidopsis arenosa]KAG7655086.1 hypothetical protein ISN44_As01g021910 [Arabidopsis suecica]ABF59203.1 unknown protein [Arabidopsis thaliana]AEE30112.1 hypothetical protein AT1G21528 [Arabidopsis thaliana]CAA0229079.1 unnamed protein product [Arabidopsis thaliana]|eukprot:NP_001077572.1 hypothetical protein AT1G21528 [Arabidopsis thaliana]